MLNPNFFLEHHEFYRQNHIKWKIKNLPTDPRKLLKVYRKQDYSFDWPNRVDLSERTKTIEQSWQLSRTTRRLTRQILENKVAAFAFQVWDKNKNTFWMGSLTLIFTLLNLETTRRGGPVAKCQLTSWRSISEKPCTDTVKTFWLLLDRGSILAWFCWF